MYVIVIYTLALFLDYTAVHYFIKKGDPANFDDKKRKTPYHRHVGRIFYNSSWNICHVLDRILEDSLYSR